MPKQTPRKSIPLSMPEELYWQLFREAARRSAKSCKRVTMTSLVLDALRCELARPDAGKED